MYLLRRRSDGKYWLNLATSRWQICRRADHGWVDDPSQCKPFRSIAATKNNRGVSLQKPFTSPKNSEWDLPGRREQYWKDMGQWYSDVNRIARMAQFDKQYEVVEVYVNVKLA